MPMMSEHIARAALERMNMREVLIAPHYGGLIADMQRMAMTDPLEANQWMVEHRRAELCTTYGIGEPDRGKPFAFSHGLAIIPVSGTLINRFGYSWGSVTGYNFIRSQLDMAMADPDVRGIVFDLSSHGGEVAGCFELVDDIYAARGGKPMLGVIDAHCYSAAYAIASALDRVVITPTGGAGSIGVVAMHIDMSKALDAAGVKVTFIHAGKHKVDGNPFEELSDEVRADIQSRVNRSYDTFVATVARNRGLSESAVRDTEAQTYRAEDALQLGLVDAIASPSKAVQAFFSELSGSKFKGGSMSEKQNTPAGDAERAAPEVAVDVEAAVAQARESERARVAGILGSEEAKGREKLASHLALKTEMSVEAAKAILAAAPKEQAPQANPRNPFREAMDRDSHPKVGADGAGDDGGNEPLYMKILRAQEAATGQKVVDR